MRRIVIALLAATVFSMGTMAVAALTEPEPGSLAHTNPLPDQVELARLIGVFERRLDGPADAVNNENLGRLYFSLARQTGSLDDYRSSRAAYAQAVRLAPTSVPANVGYGRSQAALHGFGDALVIGEQLVEQDPLNVDGWLLVGDARLELGDVDGAEAAFKYLPSDHPATVVRFAEVAHIRGDQDRAVELAGDATELAIDRQLDGRNLMFYLLLESDLLFDAGRYDEALERAQKAEALDPTWSVGHAGLAKVFAATGDVEAAKVEYRKALELQAGDPGWLASLGDLESITGNVAAADRLYADAEAINAAEAPELTGLSLAVAWADRDINSAEAVQLAADDLSRRQNIGTWDGYAWTLYRAGDYQAAREASDMAGRYGTQDGELQFHSAMIWAALGDTEQAYREIADLMDRNPQFHPVHAYTAQALLDSLRSR